MRSGDLFPFLAKLRSLVTNLGEVEAMQHRRAEMDAHFASEGRAATDRLSRVAEYQDGLIAYLEGSRDRIGALSTQAGSLDEIAADAATQMAHLRDDGRAVAEALTRMKGDSSAIANLSRMARLLAINASVEAARAGEAGSGFAVVAREMQALSDQSTARVKDIRNHLTNLDARLSEMEARMATTDTGLAELRSASAEMRAVLEGSAQRAVAMQDETNAAQESMQMELDALAEMTRTVSQADQQSQDMSELLRDNNMLAKAVADALEDATAQDAA